MRDKKTYDLDKIAEEIKRQWLIMKAKNIKKEKDRSD